MHKKNFSLILATMNREKEVDSFLESVEKSDYDLLKIEVIIVDQNEKLDLSNIIKKYCAKFDIKHIKSKVKGLSKNRNIGLKQANGLIICFPDDDCKYLKNTFEEVEKTFLNNKEISLAMGRIIDENGRDSLKSWSKEKEDITTKNFISKLSSITIFLKNSKVEFDEGLGVGEFFGSCEDADYIYQNLKNRIKAVYNPNIILYHPQSNSLNFNKDKAYNYGLGFGAFCKKNFNFQFFKFFILGSGWALFRSIIYLLKFDLGKSIIWWKSFKGRILGFIKFKKRKDI